MQWLQLTRRDVIFLQECHLPYTLGSEALLDGWKGQYFWSGSNESRCTGVVTLLGRREMSVEGTQDIIPGRLLCLDATYQGVQLRLINVYAPVRCMERKEVWESLAGLLATRRQVIVGGDFNCPLGLADLVSVKGRRKLDSSSRELRELMGTFGMVDTFRRVHGTRPEFTWADKSGGTQSRIDFIFVSDKVNVGSAGVEPFPLSDHRMVVAGLVIPGGVERGKGVWKMNVGLLAEQELVEDFKRAYASWRTLQVCFPTRVEWWGHVKCRIRKFFQCYSRRKGVGRDLRQWNARLERLYGLLKLGFPVGERIAEMKGRVASVLEKRARQLVYRARVRATEDREQCTRFFLKAGREGDNEMRELVSPTRGRQVTTEGMISVAEDFYGELYKGKGIDGGRREELLGALGKRVENPEALGERIQWEEVEGAVKGLNKNRTPGPDGIPADFYIKFWELLKEDVVQICRETLEEGQVPDDMQEGLVTLIYKGKGERRDLGGGSRTLWWF